MGALASPAPCRRAAWAAAAQVASLPCVPLSGLDTTITPSLGVQVTRHKRCRFRVTVLEKAGEVPQEGHKAS